MRIILLVVLALLPLRAGAGPVPCGYEPTLKGRAYCLQLRTETLRERIQSQIAAATSDMTAVSARDLRKFEADLRRLQSDWARKTDRGCRRETGDVAAAQMCRFRATERRRGEVTAALREARERLGLSPPIATPKEYEILIPLPGPPAGPNADVRVPLTIPLGTD